MLDISAAIEGIHTGQAYAAALMVDTFAAYSPAGKTTDADGYEVPAFTSEGESLGKTQGGRAASTGRTRTATVGGSVRTVIEAGLHLPVDAYLDETRSTRIVASEVRGLGWEFECVALGADSRGRLGARFLVVGFDPDTWKTAQRLDVVEV